MGKKRKPKMEFRYYKMPDGVPILALLGQKWKQAYGRECDYLHFHNYLEIGYCYDGEGELVLGEQSFQFHGGQFTVIPQNYPHTTNSAPNTLSQWEYLYIDVGGFCEQMKQGIYGQRAEYLAGCVNTRAVIKDASEAPRTAGLILELLEVMRRMEEMYLEEAKGILAALLVSIARENRPVQRGQESPVGEPFTIPISRALDYISLHYMEPLKIQALAKWCYMSETHFRRMFSLYMKMGPVEYINLVRIQNACDYLRKGDDSIADIAHKCGFSTLSTFNRNFKQITGSSPRVWRKRPENFEQQLLKYTIHLEEGW